MASRITYLFVAALFLLGCNSPKKEKDKAPQVAFSSEIYDEERFADIIFDLTLVEAAYRLNMTDEDAAKKRNDIFKSVLLAHETDSTVFEENWTYYGYRPERMQEVYDMVLKKIDEKRVERGAMPVNQKNENE